MGKEIYSKTYSQRSEAILQAAINYLDCVNGYFFIATAFNFVDR